MAIYRLDPEVDPGQVGVDAAVLDRIAASFSETLQAGRLCGGAQMAVYRDGKKVFDIGGGIARARRGETLSEVTPETMFVLFSSTKGLAALAMLMLYERKKFHYDEPVIAYWPEFNRVVPEKASITIRQVMGHRSGLPTGPDWLTPRHWGDRAAIARAMEELPLAFPPGSKNAYHAMNFGHLVNELITRIDGRDCGQFLRDEVCQPLGVKDLYVGLPDDDALEQRVAWVVTSRSSAASAASATGVLDEQALKAASEAGEREDDRAAAAAPAREPNVPERFKEHPERMHPMNRPEVHQAVLPAGAGIGSAADLARVYAALSLDGELDGVRLCYRQTLDHVTTATNRRGEVDGTIRTPIRWGTGFHMGAHGEGSTDRTFGHGGAGGQIAFADRDRRLAVAFVTSGALSPKYMPWRFGLQSMAFEACKD
jgi:CubicO group peptidase (beta-lactamase class C family)